MVRYHEIVNEDNSQIHNDLREYFRPATDRAIWREHETYEIVDGKVNILQEAGGCLPRTNAFSIVSDQLPFQFGSVVSIFDCRCMGLKTLKGCPTEIIPNGLIQMFRCNNNNLTSLEYIPNNINGVIQCENNPLISLDGLIEKVKPTLIELTYTPALPLLRLLLAKDGITFIKGKTNQQGAQHVEYIIKGFISNEPNIKKRILDCQYALIKAGYKGNAKW